MMPAGARICLAMLAAAMSAPQALPQPLEPLPRARPAGGQEWVLIESDILVPSEQRSYSGGARTDGLIPFHFDPAEDISSAERAAMLAAMDWWTTTTGAKLIYRTAEVNFLNITRSTDENVSSSSVGMLDIGGQHVRIWESHWTNTGLVAYELCHALGFWHEQSRPDRDDFLEIEWENIPDEREHNFAIHAESDTLGNPYDYLSIMHYSACAFSACDACSSSDPDCRTITTLDPDFQGLIGQRDELNTLDIEDLIDVYGPRTARYVAPIGGGAGTLSSPFSSLDAALGAVPTGGTLLIQGGAYDSRACSRLRASGAPTAAAHASVAELCALRGERR